MKHRIVALIAFGLYCAGLYGQAALPRVEVQSLAGGKVQLHSFLSQEGHTLIALSMGISQKNGEEQVAALLSTHASLLAPGRSWSIYASYTSA